MLRKSLIAIALLAASGGAMAGHDTHVYGRVVSVEPHFSISFSSGRHHDGFRILYEVGGHRYWTHSRHHPGHVIWVPRPVEHHVHHHKHHYKRHHNDYWRDRHDEWRSDRGHWDRHDRDGRRDHHDRY